MTRKYVALKSPTYSTFELRYWSLNARLGHFGDTSQRRLVFESVKNHQATPSVTSSLATATGLPSLVEDSAYAQLVHRQVQIAG